MQAPRYTNGLGPIRALLQTKHRVKVLKYEQEYMGVGYAFHSFVTTTSAQIHREAQRTLFHIAQRTTHQHINYYYSDLHPEVLLARNIERVNAVASAAIVLGVGLRARGLRQGSIGKDPPLRGWRAHRAPYDSVEDMPCGAILDGVDIGLEDV